MLQIEFEFNLPQGYVDPQGNVHREGSMRLTTALDEIVAMRDPRVKADEAYLSIVLLSRVITRLGTLRQVSPHVIESLFVNDLDYLQEFYRQINEEGRAHVDVVCPHCQASFEWEAVRLGG